MSQRREKRLQGLEKRVDTIEGAVAYLITPTYVLSSHQPQTTRKTILQRISSLFRRRIADKTEIIDGLKDLISDRESFFHTPPDEDDEIFRHDADVLKAAIAIIEGK